MKSLRGNQAYLRTEAMLRCSRGIRTKLPSNVLRAFGWLGSRIRYHQRQGNQAKVESLRSHARL